MVRESNNGQDFLIRDKGLMQEYADRLEEISNILKESSENSYSFSNTCRAHNMDWRKVRRLLDTESLKQCKFDCELKDLTEFADYRPSGYEKLYQDVFGVIPSEVRLPPDYKESVEAVLDTFPNRTKEILILEYGLDDTSPVSLVGIGKIYDISHQCVREIELKAIKNITCTYRREILRKGVTQYAADQDYQEKIKELRKQKIQEELDKKFKELESRNCLQELDVDLELPIEDMDFSVRSYNCLKRANINTLGDVIKKSEIELRKIRNLGTRGLAEIIEKRDSFLGLTEILRENKSEEVEE